MFTALSIVRCVGNCKIDPVLDKCAFGFDVITALALSILISLSSNGVLSMTPLLQYSCGGLGIVIMLADLISFIARPKDNSGRQPVGALN